VNFDFPLSRTHVNLHRANSYQEQLVSGPNLSRILTLVILSHQCQLIWAAMARVAMSTTCLVHPNKIVLSSAYGTFIANISL